MTGMAPSSSSADSVARAFRYRRRISLSSSVSSTCATVTPFSSSSSLYAWAETDLPYRGGGLLLFQPQRALGQFELAAAEGNGPG